MHVALISTYEIGRQPFGLASPAAWLRAEGCDVACIDLSVGQLEPRTVEVEAADLIAFHVPMHTATRLASSLVGRIREINPGAHLCFYGLYAPLNEAYLRRLGAETILGGEFEQGLVSLVRRLASRGTPVEQTEPTVSVARQQFVVPDRTTLPELKAYARLRVGPGELKTVGYTEASRGCKHHCRHCPIVPVYEGRFRVVQRDVVLEDIRRQVARGAQHITFGDPDFLNGPTHALGIVRALHDALPELTYDVTIKIEHLLRHRDALPVLRDTGCLFVTSAVEAIDSTTLEHLAKGHTRDDVIEAARLMREAGLALQPTFVTFTPWTTLASYAELLELIRELDLVDHVAPVQYAIRLLVTRASKLLEVAELRRLVGEFDEEKLVYPWTHADPRVDRLHADVMRHVREGQCADHDRRRIFHGVRSLAREALGQAEVTACDPAPPPATVPYLTEPWYC